MKITYSYRGWYVFYSNSKYVAQNSNGSVLQADSEDALLNSIDKN
jgi:1,2-phenylacetyl-CoA epoxidase PaaB subunit